MSISIQHPTDRPNFSILRMGTTTIWFSYETVIAFSVNGTLTVRENDWSATTGKHLNYVDNGDKASRVPTGRFLEIGRDAGLAL